MTGNSFDLSIGSAGPGELAEFQLSEAMQSEGARVLAVNFPRGAKLLFDGVTSQRREGLS